MGDPWLTLFWALGMVLSIGSLIAAGLFGEVVGIVGLGLTLLDVALLAITALIQMATDDKGGRQNKGG